MKNPTLPSRKRFKHLLHFAGSLLALCVMAGGHPATVHARSVSEWSMALGLYQDVKARNIGDIVTVLIEETSSVNRSATQDGGKSTAGSGSASFGNPTLEVDGAPRRNNWDSFNLPAFNWQLQQNFSGGGAISSQDDFSSTMSARVIDVLPNGTMLLEGKRTVHLENERVEVILTGLVRPRDIDSDNTVRSSRIADASIRYNSDGPIARDQRRGLITRLLNWVNLF